MVVNTIVARYNSAHIVTRVSLWDGASNWMNLAYIVPRALRAVVRGECHKFCSKNVTSVAGPRTDRQVREYTRTLCTCVVRRVL